MNPSVNLTYKRFGLLTVIDYGYQRDSRGRGKWLCRCDCGGKTYAYSHNLIGGNTTSCGCATKHNFRDKAIEFQGVTLNQKQWAERLGITQSALCYRLKHWPVDKALTR